MLFRSREGATHVLDLATLTGAMELALGDLYAGGFANDASYWPSISADGRYVVFESSADNLIATWTDEEPSLGFEPSRAPAPGALSIIICPTICPSVNSSVDTRNARRS